MNTELFAAAGFLFTAVWTSAAPKEITFSQLAASVERYKFVEVVIGFSPSATLVAAYDFVEGVIAFFQSATSVPACDLMEAVIAAALPVMLVAAYDFVEGVIAFFQSATSVPACDFMEAVIEIASPESRTPSNVGRSVRGRDSARSGNYGSTRGVK
jgi:hypothetical protein